MTRRMMLVVLAVMGVMVLVVTVSPPQQGVQDGGQSSSTPSPARPDLTGSDAFDVSQKLSVERRASEQRILAELGDRVEIIVEGRAPASVMLGELRTKQLEQGIPARFELLAETPGTYPLVLVGEGRQIGALEIR
jgi:hypothetical protein